MPPDFRCICFYVAIEKELQMAGTLTSDHKARKEIPLMSGLLWYFPNALAEVAKTSRAGNEQHNPGKPLHWDRSKSSDHADAAVRHLMQAGTLDSDGVRHLAKAAWRVLALLQEEVERDEGAPPPRNARNTPQQGEVIAHGYAAAYLRDVGERDDDAPTEHNHAAYAVATATRQDEE